MNTNFFSFTCTILLLKQFENKKYIFDQIVNLKLKIIKTISYSCKKRWNQNKDLRIYFYRKKETYKWVSLLSNYSVGNIFFRVIIKCWNVCWDVGLAAWHMSRSIKHTNTNGICTTYKRTKETTIMKKLTRSK